MTCVRCSGLLVSDYLFDLDGGAKRWALSWRCVNCGHRDDAIIHAHRHRQTHSSFLLHTEDEKSVPPSSTRTPLLAA